MSVLFLTASAKCQACHQELSSLRPGASVDGYVVHSSCFSCNECHGSLDFKTFYDLEGKPFCKTCYETKVSVCNKCRKYVLGGMIKTKDSPLTFHPECFNCDICNASLVSAGFKSMGERIFCAEDYNRRYAPRCGSCGLPAAASATERTTKRITVLEKTYHGKCFKCEGCGVQLSENDQDCFPLHGKLLCENCHVIILDNEESKDRRRQLHKKRLPSDMILEICCGNSKSTTADGKLSYSDFFAKYSEECWPSSGSVEKM